MKAIEDRTAAQLDKQKEGDDEADELDTFAQHSEQIFVVNPLSSVVESGLFKDKEKMEELRQRNMELTALHEAKMEMDREKIQLMKSSLTLQKRIGKIKEDALLLDELGIKK